MFKRMFAGKPVWVKVLAGILAVVVVVPMVVFGAIASWVGVELLSVRADVKAAASQVEENYDEESGKYQTPVFLEGKYKNNPVDVPEGSFGPVLVGDDHRMGFAQLEGGNFCLSGRTADSMEDQGVFYSSATQKMSYGPEGCLPEQTSGDTYICLPETEDMLKGYLTANITPVQFQEAMERKNAAEAKIVNDGNFDDDLTGEQSDMLAEVDEAFRNDPAVKNYYKSTDAVMDSAELVDTPLKDILTTHELYQREEALVDTPEFDAHVQSSELYNEALFNTESYDEDGNLRDDRRDIVEGLYEQAVAASSAYYFGAVCS